VGARRQRLEEDPVDHLVDVAIGRNVSRSTASWRIGPWRPSSVASTPTTNEDKSAIAFQPLLGADDGIAWSFLLKR
jgi:hypothetical protein